MLRYQKSPRQAEALERIEHQGTYNIRNPEKYEDLKKWFDFFNDIYFAGLLTGLCQIKFIDEKDKDTIFRLHGQCTSIYPAEDLDFRLRHENPSCQIVIVIRPAVHPLQRITYYLQTLLHEMLHAMFLLYECRCESGCKKEHKAQQALGDRGHHESWQRAAMMIEDASYVVLGWRHLDLGRDRALASEVSKGRMFPSDKVLSSLRLDKAKFQKVYEGYKKMAQASGPDEHEDKSFKWLKSNTCILQHGIREI